MINIILILILWCFTKMSLGQDFCVTDKDNQNVCHDGGCNSPKSEDENKPCVCDFSKNVMSGRYCGVYDDKCLSNPCKNNGKCKSGVGNHICECSQKFHGVDCEIPIKDGDKSIKMQRPSIFYRIKYEIGSETYILLVSDTFGDDQLQGNIKSVFDFRFILDYHKFLNANVSEVVYKCHRMFDDEQYKTNSCDGPDSADCQNMCELIPKLYGKLNRLSVNPYLPKMFSDVNNKVDYAFIGPFFNSKSFNGNGEEIFIDKNRRKRIGIKFELEFFLWSQKFYRDQYKFRFIQFIVDDRNFICYPFINEIEYVKNEAGQNRSTKESITEVSLIKLNKNEEWKLIIPFEFEKACDKKTLNIDPNKEKFGFSIFKTDNSTSDFKSSDSSVTINSSLITRDNHKLIINNHPLPKADKYIFYFFYVRPTDTHTILPHYMRYVEYTTLFKLKAKITGDSPIRLKNEDNTLTLDASESYNPNENPEKQKSDLLYVWKCNVPADDGCHQHVIVESKRTFRLTENVVYTFTLIVSMSKKSYVSAEKPLDGIAHIVVIPYSLTPTIKLMCISNCKPLLNPIIDFYLEIKGNFIGNEFKWYYRRSDDTNMLSVDNIALKDVPTNLLVVKKNTLEYATNYSFIVKYINPKYELTESINVTTIGRPALSGCTIQPQSGVAGKTLFNISCTRFASENNIKYVFEYYQKNKNDGVSTNDSYCATNGVLLHRGNEIITDIKLSCSKYLTVRTLNEYGITADVNLLVDILSGVKKLMNL